MILNSLRYYDFSKSKSYILLVSRILLVILFVKLGFPKLINFEQTINYMQSLNVPLPVLSAIIAVVMEVVAPIFILLGYFTRPIAIIFAFYTLGSALLGHAYWQVSPELVQSNMINFYKNISIAAGFFLLSLIGPGKYSLDKK
ncbi:DoxX family membrane protein [Acinetobacter beijerinckii]|uniref:DoxX family protein n=1 Tax=Acinetobacter beijerinckii TaxID=262668 RepID=UPI0023DDBDC6|nr:DoxX family protein [Acinetobacter beijerinckii]MDF2418495.1 DoxX family membrane protein [Acinetobacter beijerinckii]